MRKIIALILLIPSLSKASLIETSDPVIASTATLSGSVILNQNTLQSGATFYVSSGTATNLNTTTLKFADGTTQTTAASASSPGGSTGAIQFNSGSSFAGVSTFTYTGGEIGLGTSTPAASLDILVPVTTVGINILGTQLTPASGNNGQSALNALTITGATGQDSSSTLAGRVGGAGSAIVFTAGMGGTQSGVPASSFTRGGVGGSISLTAGIGGSGTAASGNNRGGSGGSVALASGNGGTSISGIGGTGANASMNGGNGGFTSAAAVSGAGGSVTLTGGNGADNNTSGGTGGSAGGISIDAGLIGNVAGGATAGSKGTISIGSNNSNAINIGNSISTTSITGVFGIGTATPSAQLQTTGSVRMSSFGAGAATFDASGNISSVSDERLKDIQGDFKASMEQLRQIKPILYKWNKKSGLEMEHVYAGFSAQNMKKNIPEAVGENKDGILSLQDRAILASVVNALNELDARISKLEGERRSKK